MTSAPPAAFGIALGGRFLKHGSRTLLVRSGGADRIAQDLFQILARDNAPGTPEERQVRQTARAVSTVERLPED